MKICSVCKFCYEDNCISCFAVQHGSLVTSRSGGCEITSRYRLVRLLSQDVSSETYEGLHINLNRPCIIKILASEILNAQPHLRECLISEAKAAVNIIHPNLVAVFECGALEISNFYIVSELIKGQILRDYLKENETLTEETAINLARQIALGLERAHRAGLVHRAVNPSNIILTFDFNNRPIVKIENFDFGGINQELLTTNNSKSKLHIEALRYMSPEQSINQTVDARTDIYSLGVVFYEMLNGRAAFDANTHEEIIRQQINDQPKLDKRLPLELERQLLKTLSLSLNENRGRRISTTADFADQLLQLEHIAARLAFTLPELPFAAESVIQKLEMQKTSVEIDDFSEIENSIDFESSEEILSEIEVIGKKEIHQTEPILNENGIISVNFDSEKIFVQTKSVNEVPYAPKTDLANAKSTIRRMTKSALKKHLSGSKPVSTLLMLSIIGFVALFTSAIFGTVMINSKSKKVSVARDNHVVTNDSKTRLKDIVVSESEAELNETTQNSEGNPTEPAVNNDWQNQLNNSLATWISATNAGDVNRQMEYYASKLNAYYRSRNASQDLVRSEKKRVFEQATVIDMEASQPNIVLSPDGHSAKMRFRKKYFIRKGQKDQSGEVLQELEWVKNGDDWKIVSERDLKVLTR